jgi:hypothetical protein
MEVDVTLSLGEIKRLLDEVAPVRIHLTARDEDRRFVELERPREVSMVPGEGVRIVTDGRVRHELAGVGLPFEVRRVQLLFIPRIVQGHHGQRLDFGFRVEEGDLENLPGLVENVVIAKVNPLLEAERLGACWEIGKTLALSLTMAERFEPLDRLLLGARAAALSVTHDSLILRLSLGIQVTRSAPRPSGPTPG